MASEDRPVSFKELPAHRVIDVAHDALTQGFDGRLLHFDYRPYEKRSPEARADYDALKKDLRSNGMRNPLITFKNHVLIGMRRYEIMVEFGTLVFRCVEILDDVSEWWKPDLPKLEALKEWYYQ